MNDAECSAAATGLDWFKSSYSGTEGGQCLEAATGEGVVHVRDSKDLTRPGIRVSRAAWAGFVAMASAPRTGV
ncbi:DUF397 domain-containing protein [Streptomyces zingiberis]|uniref:DUF397 domain-containing protein n=1 Tax=Streptomyces zingiberis TaxID=2053010 RepID=A0ABX1BU41_9ACTN|nr:DUF397 domain-containing protein [Streptomyces zingiberis]NJQ01232.1 DUF397 domain-containing protein [Streptomyces zingiberis]